VDISDIFVFDGTTNTGFRLDTDINGTGYTVSNVTTNTFRLLNEGDAIDATAFPAYYSGGKVRKAVTEVSGLWHLEGEDVVALANGYVVEDLTVTDGKITLPEPCSRIHVGLPYTAEIETLNLDAGQGQATIQGKAKKISRLSVLVENSLGMWAGPRRDAMRETGFRPPAQWGQPPDLKTGVADLTLKPDWNKEGSYVIQQRDPLPSNILGLIPDATVGGN
jgi:hypothetical protein